MQHEITAARLREFLPETLPRPGPDRVGSFKSALPLTSAGKVDNGNWPTWSVQGDSPARNPCDGSAAAVRRSELTDHGADRTPTTALLEVEDVSVRFGGIVALSSVSFGVDQGQICGLIGPNGAGKTTMFNCLTRVYQPSSGRITFSGRNVLGLAPHRVVTAGIARTFQNLALFPTMTVVENVMVGMHTKAHANWLTAALQIGVRREDRWLRERAHAILEDLGLGDVADYLTAGLPYGTLKTVELARALASQPRLLLLDEPSAGLTHSEVADLGALIARLRSEYDLAILLVEHHMQLLMGLSQNVVVLDFGQKIAEGTPAIISKDPVVVEAYLGTT